MEKRDQVIEHVADMYGRDAVSQIITFGTMAAKAVIRDVGRVLGHPYGFVDRISKLVPPDPGMTLAKAFEAEPQLPEIYEADEEVKALIDMARKLEGVTRNAGKHAGGVVIAPTKITDFAPLYCDEQGLHPVTQFDKNDVEYAGLVKFDFLGLRTLTIINWALEMINKRREKNGEGPLDIAAIPLDDKKSFDMLQRSETTAVFQLESRGMKDLIKRLQPDCFEDMIALVALFRPGPLQSGMVDNFIDRKHGREEISYPDVQWQHESLKPVLEPTYGIILYQEQVMLLSRLLADFTRGESDALRKAMGKKLRDKLDHMKPKFISGGQKNGHDPKVLEKIWADWEKFASYAFNKSHATCYSWVAYQTAYLKANYPAEYMAATMSRNISNITEITKLMDESKATGIMTKGPDVNESYLKFSVNRKGDIRFGLGAIKGVGESAVHSILEERERNGEYKDIFDFVQRVNLSACNRKNIENLALAGAFDSFPGIKREDFFVKNAKDETFTEVLVRYGNKYQMDKAAASNSLFGGENQIEVATPEIVPAPTWGDLERLNKERDLVGIYLSAHPLDEYAVILENVCNTHMIELTDLAPLQNKDVTMGGIVTGVREGYTKTGKPYGIAKIEDYSGSAEFAFFGNEWVEKKNFFMNGMFLFLRGKCQPKQWRQEEWEIKINSIELLPEVKEKIIEKLTVTAPLSAIDEEMIEEFTALVKANPGNAELYFHVQDEDGQMYVNLMSRVVKIAVQKDIMTYLKSQPMLSYKIN